VRPPTERYQLLGEIGRGGVGAVLKGHDRTLRRDLAIKVLLGEHQDHPEARRRFLEEAQIGGQLQHPGVVPVHEVGCFPDGRPWFSMKLVQGQTLAALLEQRADPAEDLPRFLTIFETVCQTLAYSRRPGWREPSGEWARECRRLLHLQGKLPDVLAGKVAPASEAERTEYAGLCALLQQHATAARLYAEAFAADPRLADDLGAEHRYNAACAATLAAAGQGTDAAELADKERARLRQQALDWLRADLVLWAKRAAGGGSAQRAAVQKGLRHWQQDNDLASVRVKEGLARLATEERLAWEKLWGDVDALLERAGRQK
jgi:hypothetical protein